jgi:exodeoxyribonuclease V beta subunit
MSFDPLRQPLAGAWSVAASAGTGKTWSITALWLRLVLEEGLRPDQVLVTTFTRAATAELSDRLLAGLEQARRALAGDAAAGDPGAAVVRRLLDQGRDARALTAAAEAARSGFDQAPISTIHGFCAALIARQALELGCDAELELVDDADAVLRQIVGEHLVAQAAVRAPHPGAAHRVARTVAAHPQAVLPDPVTEADLAPLRQAFCDGLRRTLATVKLHGATRKALEKRLAAVDPALSEPMQQAVGSETAATAARLKELSDVLAEIAPLHPLAQAVRATLPARLAAAGQRTFDDLLSVVHAALVAGDGLAAAVRRRFAAAIVDECQDIDRVQIDVFARLFLDPHQPQPAPGVRSFLVIGDPKQSIYRFRGADLGSYRQLTARMRPAPGLTIDRRADAPLVAALGGLFATHAPAFADTLGGTPIAWTPVTAHHGVRLADPGRADAALVLWSAAPQRDAALRDLAAQVATEFRRLIASGATITGEDGAARAITAGDLAVLCAGHRELHLVRAALARAGLPSQLAGRSLGSVWASDEAHDLLAWFDALDACQRRADPLPALLALAATPLLGEDGAGVEHLREDVPAQAELLGKLVREAEAVVRRGPLPVLLNHLHDAALHRRVLAAGDGERRLTNWRHLATLLHTEWLDGRRSIGALRRVCARAVAAPPSDVDEHLARLETDRAAVTLATVHAAKGLEWPIVACPFLWHRASALKRSDAPVAVVRTAEGVVVDVGSRRFPAHLAAAQQQEDEEGQRLLYVAVTRARHRLYLGLASVPATQGHANGAEASPLARLLGLTATPFDRWYAALPLPVAAPLSAAAAAEPAAAPAPVLVPPAPLAAPPPARRWTSYTAMLPQAQRHDEPWLRDRDGDDVISGDDGLLAGHGAGTALGNRVHAYLDAHCGGGRVVADPALATALAPALETPIRLGDASLALGALAGRCLTEVPIVLPTARLAPATIAAALTADPWFAAAPEREAWRAALATWSAPALAGFLQGQLDLVLPQAGRWYVADWKTTRLPRYDDATLDAAMRERHYLLQAWIYALCLHRHLARTLDDYDPERDFGGCAFLFLRGMPTGGVWFHRPAPAALAALDSLLAPAEDDG